MNNIKMLYFNRIDVSDGIDVNETNASKKCIICHYWHFLGKWFNSNHLTILNIHSVTYCCIINRISKSDAMDLLNNINPTEKSGT